MVKKSVGVLDNALDAKSCEKLTLDMYVVSTFEVEEPIIVCSLVRMAASADEKPRSDPSWCSELNVEDGSLSEEVAELDFDVIIGARPMDCVRCEDLVLSWDMELEILLDENLWLSIAYVEELSFSSDTMVIVGISVCSLTVKTLSALSEEEW